MRIKPDRLNEGAAPVGTCAATFGTFSPDKGVLGTGNNMVPGRKKKSKKKLLKRKISLAELRKILLES